MHFRIDPRAWRLGLGVAALAVLMLPGVAAARETRSLADMLGLSGDEEPARIEVAQSAEAAQLMVRQQELEEQIRNLTGQIEGLQFQLTQLQTLLESQAEANEARFRSLEGSAEPEASVTPQEPVTVAPEATASVDLTVPEEGVQPLPGEVEFDPTFVPPTDAVGQSQDPLVGTGEGDPVALGSLPAEPLDLTLGGTEPVNGDAVAQYTAAYDAMMRGDYAFAEEQFAQFLSLYPDDPQAADATNWWGETLLQRGAYDEATEVLFSGFQKFPDSPRAPDMLLKLGMALVGADERDTACRTFAEVPKRYSNLSAAFMDRLSTEMARAECPPTG